MPITILNQPLEGPSPLAQLGTAFGQGIGAGVERRRVMADLAPLIRETLETDPRYALVPPDQRQAMGRSLVRGLSDPRLARTTMMLFQGASRALEFDMERQMLEQERQRDREILQQSGSTFEQLFDLPQGTGAAAIEGGFADDITRRQAAQQRRQQEIEDRQRDEEFTLRRDRLQEAARTARAEIEANLEEQRQARVAQGVAAIRRNVAAGKDALEGLADRDLADVLTELSDDDMSRIIQTASPEDARRARRVQEAEAERSIALAERAQVDLERARTADQRERAETVLRVRIEQAENRVETYEKLVSQVAGIAAISSNEDRLGEIARTLGVPFRRGDTGATIIERAGERLEALRTRVESIAGDTEAQPSAQRQQAGAAAPAAPSGDGLFSRRLGREVTLEELQETANERDISIEELKRRLGID